MKLFAGRLTVSATTFNPRGMSVWGRVALIVCLTLGFCASIYASREFQWWLKQVIKPLPYTNILVFAVAETTVIAVWSLPLLIFPKLRDIGSLRLSWTWTVLLVLPIIALNLVFYGRLPAGAPWPVHLILVWGGLAAGVLEELAFRGYAFRNSPHTHPRLVVVTSATCFALLHFMNVSHKPLITVLATFPLTFALGLAFGIIRMASGSLALCMLSHGTIDAAWEFAKAGRAYDQMYPYPAVIVGIATILTFFLHPKLGGCWLRCDPSPNSA